MTLHIFNPENDLALACPSPYFIPPASARKMADDLLALPVWWAQTGDAVCVDSVEVARCWADGTGGICPEVRWVGRDGLPSDADVAPWGWSPLMVQRLLTGGADRSRLPDEARLARYRELSNRRHAVDMLAYLCSPDSDLGQEWRDRLCGVSYYCTGEQDIIRRMRQYPETLLKAPWSGSGKGLRLGRGGYAPPLSGWCLRQLREQGGVIVEPVYDKVSDFAMEFYADGTGIVRYTGLSVFLTTARGTYAFMADVEKGRYAIFGRLVGQRLQRPPGCGYDVVPCTGGRIPVCASLCGNQLAPHDGTSFCRFGFFPGSLFGSAFCDRL